MKTNAIIRIIAWSLVIVVLLGILIVFTFGNLLHRNVRVSETSVSVPAVEITPESTVEANACAAEHLNVHNTPNLEETPTSMIQAGEAVQVSRRETVNGIDWAYITAPQTGWVMSEYLTLQDSSVGKGRFLHVSQDPNEISELDIDWVDGTIRIQCADVEEIQISETEVSDEKYTMRMKKSGKKLSIDFCEDKDILDFDFGIHFNETFTKDLTILVPHGWTCDSLDIDAASAELYCTDLIIDEVDIDGASGKCTFDNCQVNELDVDTASGDICFNGTLDTLDCDAASAHAELLLENIPGRIDMDSMSGNLGIFLQPSAGFTLNMDSMSGDFITDFAYKETDNNSYVCGDGACKINFSSMSGIVVVNKAEAASAIPDMTTPTTAP